MHVIIRKNYRLNFPVRVFRGKLQFSADLVKKAF